MASASPGKQPHCVSVVREWRNYVRSVGCGSWVARCVVAAFGTVVVATAFCLVDPEWYLWGVTTGWVLGCLIGAPITMRRARISQGPTVPEHPGWAEALCRLLPRSVAEAWAAALVENGELPGKESPGHHWLQPAADPAQYACTLVRDPGEGTEHVTWPIGERTFTFGEPLLVATGSRGPVVLLHPPVRVPTAILAEAEYEYGDRSWPLASVVKGGADCVGDGVEALWRGHMLLDPSTERVFLLDPVTRRTTALRSMAHALIWLYLTWCVGQRET